MCSSFYVPGSVLIFGSQTIYVCMYTFRNHEESRHRGWVPRVAAVRTVFQNSGGVCVASVSMPHHGMGNQYKMTRNTSPRTETPYVLQGRVIDRGRSRACAASQNAFQAHKPPAKKHRHTEASQISNGPTHAHPLVPR